MIACRKCGNLKDAQEYSFRDKQKGIRQKQCKVCIQEKIHNHYLNNKDEYKIRVKTWVESNKEQRRRNAHNSYARNKGYPECQCCLKEDRNKFISNCPEGYEVDHIKSARHGGSHCLKNMQYLTVIEHRRKSGYGN